MMVLREKPVEVGYMAECLVRKRVEEDDFLEVRGEGRLGRVGGRGRGIKKVEKSRGEGLKRLGEWEGGGRED